MAEVQEVTVRMSKRLFAKLGRLADQAYESPETYIESALAELVRQVSAAKQQMRMFEQGSEEQHDAGGYL